MKKREKPLGLRIHEAKALLSANGFGLVEPRPMPRIGDIFRFREGNVKVLIVWHDKNPAHDPEHEFHWGGVEVGSGYTEGMWIDSKEFRRDREAYVLIGHIDLKEAWFNS